MQRNPIQSSVWPHRLAVVVGVVTTLLIVLGGLVTNTGSALAVPDWPTTFGYNMFTYPWSKMVGGILYEHSHRLLGSAVGMLTVALAVALWMGETRRWVRTLGVVAVFLVIAQGVLGGLRVLLLQNGLALIHGCVAQAFYALIIGLAVVTSRTWLAPPPFPAPAEAGRLRFLAALTPALVYAQLAFGAVLTHTGARLDAHLLFAGLVTLSTTLLVAQVLVQQPDCAALRRPALVLVVLLGIQLSLGLGAYLWRFSSLSQNTIIEVGLLILASHRLVGTLLWASVLVLTLRIARVTAAASRIASTPHLQNEALA